MGRRNRHCATHEGGIESKGGYCDKWGHEDGVIPGPCLLVNDERHILTLRGVVRPRDISPSNQVLSTSIASMEVAFDGKGIVSDANEPGFFYKLFSAITPF